MTSCVPPRMFGPSFLITVLALIAVAAVGAVTTAVADRPGWSVSDAKRLATDESLESLSSRSDSCGDGVVDNRCEWNPVSRLTGSDAAPADQTGYSVSLSGHTAVVGVPTDDDDGPASGAAYVYVGTPGSVLPWQQVAKLTASDAAAGDSFGWSVSISGNIIVVGTNTGATQSRPGSAYVFERSAAGAWTQVARLSAPDGLAGDYFGFSVSAGGNRIVVGASRGINGGSGRPGSAYVFERNAGGVDAWGQVAELTAPDSTGTDWFGGSVSICGTTVVVGAHNDDDLGFSSGSAYVFERNAGGDGIWSQAAKLLASDGGDRIDFGFSVSVHGETVSVGTRSASAYVFERNAGGREAWGEVARLTGSEADLGENFGGSVSVHEDRVLVGAFRADSQSGAVYVFERHTGGADVWGEATKLTAFDGSPGDRFGFDVSVSGNTIAVGAPGFEDAGVLSGTAYVHTIACEECDDGPANSDILPDACRADCSLPGCGDRVIDTGEECDDGNNRDGDGCTLDCVLESQCFLTVDKRCFVLPQGDDDDDDDDDDFLAGSGLATGLPHAKSDAVSFGRTPVLLGDLLGTDTTSVDPPPGGDHCTLPLPPPPPHCQGKVESLALRYRGGSCNDTTNDQDGKLECEGDALAVSPVRIVCERGRDLLLDSLAPAGIELMDTVDITAAAAGKDRLPASIECVLYDESGNRLQELRIETSCSKRIDLGDRFGALEVFGLETTKGPRVSLGHDVRYTYTIANVGHEAGLNVSAVDDRLGLIPGSPIPALEVGETIVLETSAIISEPTVNTVTVSGQAVSGGECLGATDVVTVDLEVAPAPGEPCLLPGTGLRLEYISPTRVGVSRVHGVEPGSLSPCSGIPAGWRIESMESKAPESMNK